MKLTESLINQCRVRGAFTKATTLALGVVWPPKAGWVERLVGKEISDLSYQNAMKGRMILSSSTKKAHVIREMIENDSDRNQWYHFGD